MASEQYLVPDQDILSSIFPSITDIKPAKCNVISNTFDMCTFSIHFEVEPLSGYPQDLLVRLETSGRDLATVAALQHLANFQLSDLVPTSLNVGTITNADGKQVQYSVTAFCGGTTTLEEVWDSLDHVHQQKLMQSVVHAIEKLHKLDLKNDDVRQILGKSACLSKGGVPDSPLAMQTSAGGPHLGHFPDIKQFLAGILRAKNPKVSNCTLSESPDGIMIQSTFNDVGRVEFTKSDLDILWQSVVFCHNDLEPRNLLVRQNASIETGTTGPYELVAIIDWEMAGFYPFAYEYGLKDTMLGSSNLSLSWYLLFREQAAYLLPREECHVKLIKALWIIHESKKRSMRRNVGVRVQTKWVARERVQMSSDVRRGWVREKGFPNVGPFTREDNANLELEALKELGCA